MNPESTQLIHAKSGIQTQCPFRKGGRQALVSVAITRPSVVGFENSPLPSAPGPNAMPSFVPVFLFLSY